MSTSKSFVTDLDISITLLSFFRFTINFFNSGEWLHEKNTNPHWNPNLLKLIKSLYPKIVLFFSNCFILYLTPVDEVLNLFAISVEDFLTLFESSCNILFWSREICSRSVWLFCDI